jgi:hypothetical protein
MLTTEWSLCSPDPARIKQILITIDNGIKFTLKMVITVQRDIKADPNFCISEDTGYE